MNQYVSACGTGTKFGCWMDFDWNPDDIRKAARRAFDEAKAETVNFFFSDAAPHLAGSTGTGKAALLYKCWMKVDPVGLKGTQRTNECTSWGCKGVVDTTRCVDLILKGVANQYIVKACHALYYAGRGSRSDNGASPITIHKNACKNGLLLAQPCLNGKYDFSDYIQAHKYGIAWGGGIPEEILEITRGHGPEQYAVVNEDYEAAIQAGLDSGYCFGVGHGYCASRSGGKDGCAFLSSIGGSNCSHEECILGYDDTRRYHKECLYMWDNSYDHEMEHDKIPDDYKVDGKFPSGSYFLTATDTLKRLRNGTCVSNSMVKGFPPRKLPSYATESVFS